MRENLTQPIEDYIKAIYECTAEHGRATTNQIADRLEVTPASVTGMLKKLAATKPPLVSYLKHHGVRLTAEGEKVALEIVRHHRLLEMYLHQVLGYEWDAVHEEAERLEHVISEEFEERIAQAMGNPLHDPHGDPIPTRDLHMPDSSSMLLAQMRPGQKAVVSRVRSEHADLLRYLGELGITPQAAFEVLAYSPFDETMTLRVSGREQPVILGPRITRAIFVEGIA